MSKKDNFAVIEERRNMKEIAEYLVEKFPNYFGLDLNLKHAYICATNLINTHAYTKEEILSGKYDIYIGDYISFFAASERLKDNAILKQEEERKEVEFKTRKGHSTKEKITAIILTVAMTVTLFYSVYAFSKSIKDNQLINEYSYAISMIAGYSGDKNIIQENEYSFHSESQGRVTAVDNKKVAEAIANVCRTDQTLLDVTLQNTYDNLQYDKLNNMDKILNNLKDISSKDSSLSIVSERLKDCEVFLEFLIKTGKITPEDKDYEKLFYDIEQYRILKQEGKGFSSLNAESQERITKLMECYEEDMNFYKAYENTIKKIPNQLEVGLDQGTRS